MATLRLLYRGRLVNQEKLRRSGTQTTLRWCLLCSLRYWNLFTLAIQFLPLTGLSAFLMCAKIHEQKHIKILGYWQWLKFPKLYISLLLQVFLALEVPMGVITTLHIISSSIVDFLDYSIIKVTNNVFCSIIIRWTKSYYTHTINHLHRYVYCLNFQAVILIVNLFICMSYPLNFGIYCGMSKQFRDTFKELFPFLFKNNNRRRNNGDGGRIGSTLRNNLRRSRDQDNPTTIANQVCW